MYYEITVSKDGYHLFSTAEGSITSIYALNRIRPILEEKFPKEEGYKITIIHWEKTGKYID